MPCLPEEPLDNKRYVDERRRGWGRTGSDDMNRCQNDLRRELQEVERRMNNFPEELRRDIAVEIMDHFRIQADVMAAMAGL
jgi:hypothetical protein